MDRQESASRSPNLESISWVNEGNRFSLHAVQPEMNVVGGSTLGLLRLYPTPATVIRRKSQNKEAVSAGVSEGLLTIMRKKGEGLGSESRACDTPVRLTAKTRASKVCEGDLYKLQLWLIGGLSYISGLWM